MKIEFIANELCVKNNRSLKNRDQIGIEIEAERGQLGVILGLEAFPRESHFKVTIEPMGGEYKNLPDRVAPVIEKEIPVPGKLSTSQHFRLKLKKYWEDQWQGLYPDFQEYYERVYSKLENNLDEVIKFLNMKP